MPTSSTRAPASGAACVMRGQVVPRSSPAAGRAGRRCRRVRSPRGVGWCCASSAGRRERPPEVVSPLMLALTTRGGDLLGRQPLLQQRDPAAAALQAILGAQRVARPPGSPAAPAAASAWHGARSGSASTPAAIKCAALVNRSNKTSMSDTHHFRRTRLQVGDRFHRHARHSARYRFLAGRPGNRGHRRRLGLGQEHAAVHHRRPGHAHPRHRAAGRRRTCSRSTRTRAPRCGRRRSASSSRASSCWAT